MHNLLNHPLAFWSILAVLAIIGGATGGMLVSIVIEPHVAVVSAIGTWTIGIIGAIAGWYYFQVDHKKDISVQFSPVIEEGSDGHPHVFYKLQAYNDSKIGNVVSAERIYVSINYLSRSKVVHDYSEKKDKLPFIRIDKELVEDNFQEYYSVQPYGITPELTFLQEKFKSNIAGVLPIQMDCKKTDKCYLTFVFSDVNDSPYTFQYRFEL
ncbi:hypothetical protein DIS17_04045 [Levilactobacillus brevis]|uniref:Uncharacterized protein n=1 Tax=Levilactobacillus brevis TaxID=1580 RepID=A0AAJ5FLC2_LEVBR|nr:DoxX family protein [Levilactobacillus brevis]TOZ05122.1 hypothetical protein DIS17_04045 [Levilactobacillus brevis]